MRPSLLPRLLLGAYALLVAYASLYPLTGWQEPGASPFAFLAQPWPRYLTAFDVAANLCAYFPLGALCALALHPRLRGAGAALAGTLAGLVLSLSLEAAQSYLPSRVASNLDVLANVLGAAAGGAAGALAAPWLLDAGPLRRLRAQTLERGADADLGLILVGLWLFAQLNPETLPFATGDLRSLLSVNTPREYGAELFITVEALTAAANLAAAALLASLVIRPGAPGRIALLAGMLAAALGVKALAFALLMRPEDALAWFTPGAQQGLVAGALIVLLALALTRTARLALAAVLLMAATVLVNLAPPNPYTEATLRVWQQGHFLNFNGLTRLVSAIWPFAALAYLIVLAARRGRERGLG